MQWIVKQEKLTIFYKNQLNKIINTYCVVNIIQDKSTTRHTTKIFDRTMMLRITGLAKDFLIG